MGFKPCPWAWEARLQLGGAPSQGRYFAGGGPQPLVNPGLDRSAGAFLVFRGRSKIHQISTTAGVRDPGGVGDWERLAAALWSPAPLSGLGISQGSPCYR